MEEDTLINQIAWRGKQKQYPKRYGLEKALTVYKVKF
jgi:hypothetical protein